MLGERLGISIHALREEGDRLVWSTSKNDRVFLSTPSARRATDFLYNVKAFLKISIHALREEGDRYPAGLQGYC